MFIGTVYEMTTKKRVIQTAMGIPNLVNSINNNNNNNGNIAVLNGHTNKGFVGKQLELHDTHMHQHIELQNGTTVINNGVDQHMNAKPQVVVPVVVKLSILYNSNKLNNMKITQNVPNRYVPSSCAMLWSDFELESHYFFKEITGCKLLNIITY